MTSLLSCLREIIQNILEQAHFTDEDKQHVYAMYDPSVNYDESAVHDYGGYLSTNVCEISVHSDLTNSTEDAAESKQPSAMSVRSSSSSSLSKIRHNSEENPLNYDDTDPESDDDDDSKRSKSSDDKRIFVKELNYVKGRQVGLLIGPFGRVVVRPETRLYTPLVSSRSTYHSDSWTDRGKNSSDKWRQWTLGD